MSDDQNPSGGTLLDGSVSTVTSPTGVHPVLPNAPGWFGALARDPIKALAFVGVLALSGVQVGDLLIGEREDAAAVEVRLKDEIARAERENADRALLEKAAECADKIDKHAHEVTGENGFASELRQRDDDKFAFMSEITLYVERVAHALLGKREKPAKGDRLDEFTKKGTLRGLRRD